jgi:hypothetical protein
VRARKTHHSRGKSRENYAEFDDDACAIVVIDPSTIARDVTATKSAVRVRRAERVVYTVNERRSTHRTFRHGF